MASPQQDTFTDESNLNETLGSEVTGGDLISEDLQGDNVLTYNGSSTKIIVSDDASLTPTDMTILAWIKPDTLGTDDVIVGKRGSGNDYRFFINDTNGALRFNRWETGGSNVVSINKTTALTTDVWQQVGVTSTAAGANALYRDGEQIASDTDTAYTASNSASELGIGYSSVAGGRYFDGEMAQVLFFNVALTEEQIREIYAVGYENANVPTAVSYWKLDEGTGTTATDSVGSNDGTITGATWGEGKIYTQRSRTTSDDKLGSADTPTSITDFKYTTSKKPGGVSNRVAFSEDYDVEREDVLSFDGSNDYVRNSSAVVSAYPFTMSGWFKTTETSGTVVGIFDTTTNAFYTAIYVSGDNKATLTIDDDVVAGVIKSTDDVTDGNWHHMVGVFTSTTDRKLYLDGIEVNSDTTSVGFPSGLDTTSIGVFDRSTQSTLMEGQVADVRIYDDALTADEVNYLYTNGKQGTDPTTTNLVSQWLLDEGTGTTATDNEGSNDGTITGATWDTDTDLAHKLATWKNSNNDTLVTGGYSFDGTNDSINLGDNLDLEFNTAFSIFSWVKTSDITNQGAVLDKYSGTGNEREYSVRINAQKLKISFGDPSDGTFEGNYESDNNVISEVGKWYHVGYTYNAGTVKTYLNGVEASGSTTNGSIPSSLYNGSSEAHIGGDEGNSVPFEGDISDVRVYSEALSASDIWSLYADSVEPDDTNLEGHWRLNGNTLDETSNNNDGTNNGATPLGQWTSKPALGDATNQREVASFDGTNDSVDVADAGDISTDQDLTISAWVKTTPGAYYPTIIGMDDEIDSDNDPFFYLRLTDSGYANIGIRDKETASTDLITVKGTTDLTGSWHNLTLVFDKSAKQGWLYVDGQLIGTDTASTMDTSKLSTGIQKIGVRTLDRPTYSENLWFNGQIANVAIYNDVRTASEILTDYENGYIDESNANLVSYWKLDGDYLDAVGSNDGTNSGSTMIDSITAPLSNEGDTQVTLDISGLSFTDTIFVRDYMDNMVKDVTRPYALTSWQIDYLSAVTFIPKIMFY